MNSFLYKFSIFTIFIGFVHFILETSFTIQFGQTVAGYLPDLIAVAQTLRYMGYIKKELATNDEKVKGCIIGTQEDRNLVNAISMVPDIDFYRYNINFSLNRVEF